MPDPKPLDANTESDSSADSTNEHDANNASPTSGEESSDEIKSTAENVSDILDEGTEDDTGVEGSDQDAELDSDEDSNAENDSADDDSEDTADDEDDDSEDENEDEVPEEFHKHPAWKRQIDKRKAAESESAEKDKVIAEMQPKIQLLDSMGKDNIDFFAQFMVAAQQNPLKALELINPTLQDLLERSGHKLSPELQQQVEDGELTKEQAMEISKLKAENQNLKSSGKSKDEDSKSAASEANSKALHDAAVSWETRMRDKDPDFHLIAETMRDKMEVDLMKNGTPALGELNGYMDKLYSEVKARFKGITPKKKKTPPRAKGNAKSPNGKEKKVYKGKTSHEQIGSIVNDLL